MKNLHKKIKQDDKEIVLEELFPIENLEKIFKELSHKNYQKYLKTEKEAFKVFNIKKK